MVGLEVARDYRLFEIFEKFQSRKTLNKIL